MPATRRQLRLEVKRYDLLDGLCSFFHGVNCITPFNLQVVTRGLTKYVIIDKRIRSLLDCVSDP
jgi:hypothetical protein